MRDKIIRFLITAKQSTYAGKGAETQSSRIKSNDLIYREDDLLYYDTYLGGERFAGEEAIWIEDVSYWSMNYVGRVTGANFSGDFLKEALLNVPFDMPYRGPEHYSHGEYTYECKAVGGFEWFQGREAIFYRGAEIHECYFHGGLVQ